MNTYLCVKKLSGESKDGVKVYKNIIVCLNDKFWAGIEVVSHNVGLEILEPCWLIFTQLEWTLYMFWLL